VKKNLVITSAINYDWKKIKLFLRSFLKYLSKEDLIIIIGIKDIKLKKILIKYKVKYYEVKVHRYDIQQKRYCFYLDILKKNFHEKVLICDSRDIFFQKNIFLFNFRKKINFFLEDKKIKDEEANSHWILNSLGSKEFNKISNKSISCSGTVLGRRDAIVDYCNLINQCFKTHPYKKRLKYILLFQTDKDSRGVDQAYHNFLIYNNYFKCFQLFDNKSGPIATVGLSQILKFNSNGKLINNKKKIFSMVHQYDRKLDHFKKKNYLRNLL